MLEKTLRYYRLKRGMTKKMLAEAAGLSPMAISYYENGKRRPGMDTLKALAGVFGIRVTDFLSSGPENLTFVHGKFRKGCRLSAIEQEYIQEYTEEYLGRYFEAISFLGGEQVLGKVIQVNGIPYAEDTEKMAKELRKILHLSEYGPVGNLIGAMENNGILIVPIEIENDAFSGRNGTVNKIPYIAYNKQMSTARTRSTLVHELAHLAINWPEDMDEKQEEKKVTAISGAFLFPKDNVLQELGFHRTRISRDMEITCREYGISMYLLTKRAAQCRVIHASAEREFYIKAGQAGWKKCEPDHGIAKENPTLFRQLVYRAVTEQEITVQRGAELIGDTYDSVCAACGL